MLIARPSLADVLARLPWFEHLTQPHRMEVTARLVSEPPGYDFTTLLVAWRRVADDDAHQEAKRRRLELLVDAGLLTPAVGPDSR